jgi:hypothetical protein
MGRYLPKVALNEARFAKLHRTLRSQDIACLVTDFRIQLMNHRRSRNGKRPSCICHGFDALLGQVLLSLENLQVLYFSRPSCWHAKHLQYSYLERLPTRQLQQLQFFCPFHLNENTVIDIPRFLTSPCVATVTSLCLSDDFKPIGCDALSTNNYLPHLKKLICSNLELVQVLLPKRTITHLGCPNTDFDQLHTIIQQTPCSLTHLDVSDRDYGVANLISMNPNPYQSLKHFAEFVLMESEVRF